MLKATLENETEGKKILEEQIKSQQETINNLKTDLMLAKLQKEDLLNTNENLKNRNETSQNEVDHILKLFNDQTLESKKLSTEVAKLRDDLETKEKFMSKLKLNVSNNRKLMKKVNKLEMDNENLNSKNRLLELENSSLKEEINMYNGNPQEQQFYQAQQRQVQNPYQQQQNQDPKKAKLDNFHKNAVDVRELLQKIENLSDKFNKDSQQKSQQIDELGKKVSSLKESQSALAKNIGNKSNT